MSYSIVLVSAALTVVFVRGTLFDAFRRNGPALWRELCSCALCMGVWVGGAAAALELSSKAPVDLWFAYSVLATGAQAGVVAWLVVAVENYLDSTAAQRDAVGKTLQHLPQLTEKVLEVAREQRERERQARSRAAQRWVKEPANAEESRA